MTKGKPTERKLRDGHRKHEYFTLNCKLCEERYQGVASSTTKRKPPAEWLEMSETNHFAWAEDAVPMIGMPYKRYLERLDLATQNALEVAAVTCDERSESQFNVGNNARAAEAEACATAIRAKKSGA